MNFYCLLGYYYSLINKHSFKTNFFLLKTNLIYNLNINQLVLTSKNHSLFKNYQREHWGKSIRHRPGL